MDKREYVESLLQYIRDHKSIKEPEGPIKMADGGELDVGSLGEVQQANEPEQPTEAPQEAPIGAQVGAGVPGQIGKTLSSLESVLTGSNFRDQNVNNASANTNLSPPPQTEDRSTLGQQAKDISKPQKSYKQAYAETPDAYKTIIEGNMKLAYQEQYGFMPNPPVSYKQFYEQTMNQTKGFNPLKSGGILNYKDPAGADAYNNSVDLVRSMASIDFNKAMDYGLGSWTNQPGLIGAGMAGWANIKNSIGAAGGDENLQAARYNYERLVDALAAAVTKPGGDKKASIPAVENMLMELRTSGMNKTQMKAQLLNTIETRFQIPLSGLDQMGLTDKWFKTKMNY